MSSLSCHLAASLSIILINAMGSRQVAEAFDIATDDLEVRERVRERETISCACALTIL